MPLTHLLNMTNGKEHASRERASISSAPPARPEPDICELVWENGQVMIQGLSSKARKGPLSINDYQSFILNSQDGRDVNCPKTNKFSSMDYVFGETGQDVDMGPWLSYPTEDPLHNDYTCDFLSDLSGVTIDEISNDNNLAFREKKSDFHGLSRHNIPRSGVSGITSDSVGNNNNIASQDINAPSLCAFTSLRLKKLDSGQPSTSSSFTNFPYFSRSSALIKANHVNVNTLKRSENDEPNDSMVFNLPSTSSQKEIGTQNQSIQTPVNEMSWSLPTKPDEEMLSTKRTLREEDGMNDVQQNHGFETTRNKGGERIMEPVVTTSSVGSGNNVDRASNERAYDLKRKSRETAESEGPSEEVEDESVGRKKNAHARGSSKRSRAAEVHNLSERKRRDRINEKMRALQELIPNCNKVDKASMLDEAIDYLKTLQLQLQMMSIGAGMYMHPMMLPPGMPSVHGAQMPPFPPMGLGMGMGMGFGMAGPHYPVPGPFHGLSAPSSQPFGHPGQGLQMSMQQSQLHSIPGSSPMNMPMGSDVSGVASSSGASNLVPSTTSTVFGPPTIIPNIPINPATNEATKEGIQPSHLCHGREENAKNSESPLAASKINNVA